MMLDHEFVKSVTNEYEEAAKALCDAVEEEYPVGVTLRVELGGHLLDIQVTGHSGSWWYSPGTIFGRNIDTGKDRKFTPSDIKL